MEVDETNVGGGPIMISNIGLSDILSFGPGFGGISLGSLNVFIGPNGSGKSNLIDVMNLLRSLPTDLPDAIRKGGGFSAWVFKGKEGSSAQEGRALPLVAVEMPSASGHEMRHTFTLLRHNGSYVVGQELITPLSNPDDIRTLEVNRTVLNSPPIREELGSFARRINPPGLKVDQSVLSQLHNPDLRDFLFQEIGGGQYEKEGFFKAAFDLSEQYKKIRIYREFQFGRSSDIRQPYSKDNQDDYLKEDCSNLALFLNRILAEPSIKEKYLEHLQYIYDGITDIKFMDLHQWVEIVILEEDVEIRAIRLSDGTLRYMCLLAILLDPNPAPLVCIEEPELGMHPDIIIKIARLLIEASQRTQLIVTTHSDIIIDALTEMPESVYVCEKHNGITQIQRLKAEEIAPYAENYRLGELWTRGGIGGTRW